MPTLVFTNMDSSSKLSTQGFRKPVTCQPQASLPVNNGFTLAVLELEKGEETSVSWYYDNDDHISGRCIVKRNEAGIYSVTWDKQHGLRAADIRQDKDGRYLVDMYLP